MASFGKKKLFLFSLRTSKKGIRQVLGDLEADIMEQMWLRSPASVREVHDSLAENRTIAYTTVMTVMGRLAQKGVLKRQQRGRAFLYQPTCSREEFCSNAVNTVVEGLLGGFGEPVLSQFVDSVSNHDAATLDQLVRLIEEKKKQKEA